MSTIDIATIEASIKSLEPYCGKHLFSLPIMIEDNLHAPLASTNLHGIWIRRDVAENEPEFASTYVMHELLHHVLGDHSQTGMYDHNTVNYAEDYSINWTMYKKFGLDVRKLQHKLLFSRKLGPMPIKKIAQHLKKQAAEHGQEPKLQGCHCIGSGDGSIRAVVDSIRKYLGIQRDPLVVCDHVDAEKYEEEHDRVRHNVAIKSVYTDEPTLMRAVWLRAYMPKTVPTKYGKTLTAEQAIAYCWETSDRSRDLEAATISTVVYLRVLSKYDDILMQDYHRAVERVSACNYRITKYSVMLTKKSSKIPKPVARKKLKLAQKLLPKLQALVIKRKAATEIPLKKLFRDYPLEVVTRKTFSSVSNSLSKNRRVVIRNVGILRVKSNPLMKAIRRISRMTEKLIQKTLDTFSDIRKLLSDLTEEEEEGTVKEGGEGRGHGKGQPTKTALDEVLEMDEDALDMMTEIMTYMKEFKTLLSSKRRSKPDPLSNTPDVNPDYGNDLSKIVASEMALMTNELTKMAFFAKLADGGLLVTQPQEAKRSPIVIAIDASGSMMGQPYNMASGFALAMLVKLKEDRRGGAMCLFTSEITFTQTMKEGKPFSLPKLIRALVNPHNGGTDFDAPLLEAYRIKEAEKWSGLTTIIITDGGSAVSSPVRYKIREEKGPNDHITAVLVRGSDTGFYGLNDDTVKVTKETMQYSLASVGNKSL